MLTVKEKVDQILRWVLTPLSWIYGAVMWVRNKLFDLGILPQVEFDVPVVGVGNLTVGGTGKTPHTEFIISHLCSDYNVAVLSRGYKRETKGFIVANSKSTPSTIGDEPWQIYNKFGRLVKVAVCENRKKGITELLKLYPDLELIVLDDSFQHRWVKPRISVLLMDYSRPVYKDKLLPLGRLRESSHEINRADKVIVTKCPENLNPIDLRIVTKELDLMKFQKIYFSRYSYGDLSPVFAEDAKFSVRLSALGSKDSVMLLTGIANPRYFVRHFKGYPFRIKVNHFPDHHHFSRSDIAGIEQKFRSMKGEKKIIITTEKDAVRLVHNPYFPTELKPFVFYQPITVKMIPGPAGHDNNLISDIKHELRLADVGTEIPEPVDTTLGNVFHDGVSDLQSEEISSYERDLSGYDMDHTDYYDNEDSVSSEYDDDEKLNSESDKNFEPGVFGFDSGVDRKPPRDFED